MPSSIDEKNIGYYIACKDSSFSKHPNNGLFFLFRLDFLEFCVLECCVFNVMVAYLGLLFEVGMGENGLFDVRNIKKYWKEGIRL